jgi:hypothetical protein
MRFQKSIRLKLGFGFKKMNFYQKTGFSLHSQRGQNANSLQSKGGANLPGIAMWRDLRAMGLAPYGTLDSPSLHLA